MTADPTPDWRRAARPFEEGAAEYDRWYADNPLFTAELAALRAVQTPQPHPRLEIGVGPGRFAEALDIGFGLDPAISPLHIAGGRSIIGINGIGEQLPLQSGILGTVYLLFTLCFLADPAAVLAECRRVLDNDGRLVVGMVPALSGLGRQLAEKAAANHPYYRHARLRTIEETVRLLGRNLFRVTESWSTLLHGTGGEPGPEKPMAGAFEQAGFCVLVCMRGKEK